MGLDKKWRRIDIDIPIVGKCEADVYVGHDQWMGKSRVSPLNKDIPYFVSPNMPKLKYFFNFQYVDHGIKPLGLLEILKDYAGEASVDVKRDGFCVLFYPVYDADRNLVAILPKSRRLPVAKGDLLKVTMSDYCPTKKIEEMISDGYAPIFECWGPGLEKYDLETGCSDKFATVRLESLPDINFDVISILKNNYNFSDENNYTRVKFRDRWSLCKKYGLNCVKSYGLMTLKGGNVVGAQDTGLHNVSISGACKKSGDLGHVLFKLYDLFDDANREHGAIITEGAVLHTDYGMFKLKSREVTLHDVEVAKRIIPDDVVLTEIGKVKLERSVEDFIYRTDLVIEDVVMYLSETHMVTRGNISNIKAAVLRETCAMIKKSFPDSTPEFAGRSGWHKFAIASLATYG